MATANLELTIHTEAWRVRVMLGIIRALLGLVKVVMIPLTLGRRRTRRSSKITIPIYIAAGWPRLTPGCAHRWEPLDEDHVICHKCGEIEEDARD